MRYIPDLIPKERRVLPEYFKSFGKQGLSENSTAIVIGYVTGILAFLGSLIFISHVDVSVLLALIGYSAQVDHFISRQSDHLKLTRKL